MRLAAHEPSHQLPLAEVRAEIENALLTKAAQTEAARLAEEAIGKLQAGQAFEVVAKQYGMEINTSRSYARKAAAVEPALLAALFKAAHPHDGKPVFGTAALAEGTVALFSLSRVIEPVKTEFAGSEADALRKVLEARRGKEFLDSYRASLRQQAKIKIYKDQM